MLGTINSLKINSSSDSTRVDTTYEYVDASGETQNVTLDLSGGQFNFYIRASF